jgi:hypothetical protein
LDLLDEETNDVQDLKTMRLEDERSEAFDSDDILRPLKINSERLQAEEELFLPEELGGVSSETASYILQLQAKLSAASKVSCFDRPNGRLCGLT